MSEDFDPFEPVNPTGNPAIDELNSLLQTLALYDDRGLVLALASFADDSLGRLLLAYLREEKVAKELVEGASAPLGTFSARIKACLAMGLITKLQYRDLELLRKIRNRFAHEWHSISCERNDIAAMIGQLEGTPLYIEDDGVPSHRLQDAVTATLIQIRYLLKTLRRASHRLPQIGADPGPPMRPTLVEVDHITQRDCER